MTKQNLIDIVLIMGDLISGSRKVLQYTVEKMDEQEAAEYR